MHLSVWQNKSQHQWMLTAVIMGMRKNGYFSGFINTEQ
jgi:hypothetical protein